MKPLTIYPYLLGSTWVFDDARTGLKEEAFVCGASEMISAVVEGKSMPNAAKGISLSFADERFDGFDVELHWSKADSPDHPMAGNWYKGSIQGQPMECWLCPALTLYFQTAPKTLYAFVEPLPEGVNPIWNPGPNEQGRRFVGVDQK